VRLSKPELRPTNKADGSVTSSVQSTDLCIGDCSWIDVRMDSPAASSRHGSSASPKWELKV
jgi:hypothetical protein